MRKLGSHQDVMAATVGIFSIECLESESCAVLSLSLSYLNQNYFFQKNTDLKESEYLMAKVGESFFTSDYNS